MWTKHRLLRGHNINEPVPYERSHKGDSNAFFQFFFFILFTDNFGRHFTSFPSCAFGISLGFSFFFIFVPFHSINEIISKMITIELRMLFMFDYIVSFLFLVFLPFRIEMPFELPNLPCIHNGITKITSERREKKANSE